MVKHGTHMQSTPGLYIEPARGTGPSMFQDTFSTLSFITVGDKYGTCSEEKFLRMMLWNSKIPLKGTRFAGKQFSTSFPKKGSVADAYFTKDFKVLGGDYASTQPQRYLKTQPREKRKQGFLSGDASKRDEAMNSTMASILASTFKKELSSQHAANARAEQERQRLGYETQKSAPEGLQGHSAAEDVAGHANGLSGRRTSTDPHGLKSYRKGAKSALLKVDRMYQEGRSGPEFLFDIGRGAETSFCSRSKRERWFEPRVHACNCTWSQGDKVVQGVEKRLGSTAIHLASQDIGLGARELQEYTRRTKEPVEFEASPHSRRSVLQQQLNRNSGALLPPFTQTSISAAGPPGSTITL